MGERGTVPTYLNEYMPQRRKTGPRARSLRECEEHVRSRLSEYAKVNQLKTLDCWYSNVGLSAIKKIVGPAATKAFGNDSIAILQILFPDEEVLPWKFKMSPMGLWKEKGNRVRYIKWLAKELGITVVDGWYNISRGDVQDRHGAGLLQSHTLPELIREAYPEDRFDSREMRVISNGQAKDLEYQRWFIESALEADGIPCDRESLVALSVDTLKKFHKGKAMSILRHYPTLPDCLIAVFPEFSMKKLEFVRKGRGYWGDLENHREAVIALGARLGFRTPTDWYAVRVADFENFKLFRVLESYASSPAKVITSLFPEWGLQEHLFAMQRLQSQLRVFGLFRALFWGYDQPIWNDRKTHGLQFSDSSRGVEFDIYFPKLRIAIEVQGAQHYQAVEPWGGEEALAAIQRRDDEKRTLAARHGINLFEFDLREWDGSVKSFLDISGKGSLMATYEVSEFLRNLEKLGVVETSLLELSPDQSYGFREIRSVRPNLELLSKEQILKWADRHFERFDCWPKRNSHQVIDSVGGVSWGVVNNRLVRGQVEGTSATSLADLLKEERGVLHHLAKPSLTVEKILVWADAFYAVNGRWPTHNDGRISGTESETWGGVRRALMSGGRGLQVRGSTLSSFLLEHRGVKPKHLGRNSSLSKG